MKQIKQESGRSMVEMLGVLAVIGVLSVGGISGYTLAMNKHRANTVAADLMKRAVVISAQRQLGQPAPNMDSFGYKVGDYTIDKNVDTPAADKFAMKVKAVPQEVCEKILALDWDNAAISPDTAEGCNGGDMIFTYNDDLSPVTDGEEPTCTGIFCGANCCPTGATCGENNECCIGETCAEAGQELYCVETNASGDCISWDACDGDHTGDSILGTYKSIGCCVEARYANHQHCYVETAEVVNGTTHVEWTGCTDNYSTQDYALQTLNDVENGQSYGICEEADTTGKKIGCEEWASDDGTQYCFSWVFCPDDNYDATTETCKYE